HDGARTLDDRHSGRTNHRRRVEVKRGDEGRDDDGKDDDGEGENGSEAQGREPVGGPSNGVHLKKPIPSEGYPPFSQPVSPGIASGRPRDREYLEVTA